MLYKIAERKKNWLLFLGILLSITVLAQESEDSIQREQEDSILSVQQQAGSKLIEKADSIQQADSLEQADLLIQIEALQSSDQSKKEGLKRKLDSLQILHEARDRKIKARVDSLRSSTKGVPMVLFGDTLFYIYTKLGPFSPHDRASSIRIKVENLVKNNQFSAKKLVILDGEEIHDLMHEEMIILSITKRDAFWVDKEQGALALAYKDLIQQRVSDYRKDTSLMRNALRVGAILLVIIILFLFIKFLNRGFNKLIAWIRLRSDRYLNGIKIRNYEFLSEERELEVVTFLLNILKWIIIVLITYLSLPLVFSVFPATEGFSRTLIGYVLDPLKSIGGAVVAYIPNLITVFVIVTLVFYILKFFKFITREIESEKLHIPGFYPDWALPTYNLLRILVLAFTFIVIFPYLPGSDSAVFQGVGIFFGLLISLGSSSAISNIIAGLVITYMRAFRIGDRVQIGETTGDVLEKTILVTRVKTIKNEIITIPNAAILNGRTINYSEASKVVGLILHTTVTIGYDVPWRKVHELLIDAALKTDMVKKEPKPFVMQTSLDDFYVSYQINAYTEHEKGTAKIYSDLYANIQDHFNEAGIEIMSPHYRAARDGNMSTIPPEKLPKGYVAPSFRVSDPEQKGT